MAEANLELYQLAVQRALTDFRYFAERCVYIRQKNGVVGTLKLNKVQNAFIDEIEKQEKAGQPIRIIILKARQMGISTVIQAYALWRMLRASNVNVLEIAHDRKSAAGILDINRFAIKHIPGWFRAIKNVEEEYFTKYEITFAGLGSSLSISSSESKEPGRSQTIHIVHLSEVAFFEDAERIVRPLFAAVPKLPNTAIFIESTGNGPAGFFYDLYMRSLNAEKAGKPTAYKALFFPWYVHDEYEMPVPEGTIVYEPPELAHLHLPKEKLYWRQRIIEDDYNGDEDAFKLEYPATVEDAFISTEATIFNSKAILQRLREIENVKYVEGFLTRRLMDSPPEFIQQDGERFRIFKFPDKTHLYVIGADTGSGIVVNREGDYSSADVVDVMTGEQVAQLHLLAEPTSYAEDLYNLGMFYNTALIAVEADGHGLSVMNKLREMGYTRIYQRRVFDKISNQWVGKIGWATTPKTKKLIIDSLRADFYNMTLIINNKETLNEMATFVKLANKSDSMGAVVGAHDDRVMSLAIANQVRRDYANYNLQDFISNTQENTEMQAEPTLAQQIRQSIYNRKNYHSELGRYY